MGRLIWIVIIALVSAMAFGSVLSGLHALQDLG